MTKAVPTQPTPKTEFAVYQYGLWISWIVFLEFLAFGTITRPISSQADQGLLEWIGSASTILSTKLQQLEKRSREISWSWVFSNDVNLSWHWRQRPPDWFPEGGNIVEGPEWGDQMTATAFQFRAPPYLFSFDVRYPTVQDYAMKIDRAARSKKSALSTPTPTLP